MDPTTDSADSESEDRWADATADSPTDLLVDSVEGGHRQSAPPLERRPAPTRTPDPPANGKGSGAKGNGDKGNGDKGNGDKGTASSDTDEDAGTDADDDTGDVLVAEDGPGEAIAEPPVDTDTDTPVAEPVALPAPPDTIDLTVLPAPPPAPPDLPNPPDLTGEHPVLTDAPTAPPPGPPAAPPRPPLPRRHPRLTTAVAIATVILLVPGVTFAQALTKEGQESVPARTAQWARDMRLGFLVDWAERRKFADDEYADATGEPDATAFAPSQTTSAPTTAARSTTTTKPLPPHLPPPARMIGPVLPMAEGEGVWEPTGPLTEGLPGVYTTKVRPDTNHKALTIFVAWIDPKLTAVQLFPGTNLPGGKWAMPNFIPAERCPQAIMAANGGFRMDQARGGYYAEGREPYKLRDGAASLVLYKDGHVDVGLWGRDAGRGQLGEIESVRQNLELLVDGGQVVPNLLSRDWGAELPNSYFVWRSAWGVTAAGALVYVGGPALKPDDLAQHLVNAGAVRAMQGDINPEWVTAVLYSSNPATGQCSGRLGLPGASNNGGMYASPNRYLSTDTRDFIAVFAR